MTILEHPEAQTLLADAVLTPHQLQQLAADIERFLQRYASCFRRCEQRGHAQAILQGKLSALSRKTSEPIALHLGIRRESLQDFIGSSPWDDRVVLDTLRQHVLQLWQDPQGVLIGDGSAFPKKGEHSCGVKRQHCGRLGKVENCQLGLFLSYATRHGHTLLEHRLFLPPEWANDPQRRQQTGVPAEVVYQETWQILLDQIDRVRHHVPHRWIVADAEFGRVNAFREALRDRQERYVVDVRSDLRLRDLRATPPPRQGATGRLPQVPPPTKAHLWAQTQPAAAWQRFEIRGGEKGPLRVEAIQTEVETYEDNRIGPQERLVVIRTVNTEPAKQWYTLSNATAEIELAEVVWAHGPRHWEEDDLRECKSEVGMSHYEVRGWVGWHHHMTLSLLALWFLVQERQELKKNAGANGKCVTRGVQSNPGVAAVEVGLDPPGAK